MARLKMAWFWHDLCCRSPSCSTSSSFLMPPFFSLHFLLSPSDYLAMWFATFTWRRICNSYMFISIFYFDTCLLNKFFRIINIAAIYSQSIEVNESCISALKLYWILFFLRFPCYFTFTLEFCQFSTYRYSCPLDKMYLL